jgi:hypothetical protein
VAGAGSGWANFSSNAVRAFSWASLSGGMMTGLTGVAGADAIAGTGTTTG